MEPNKFEDHIRTQLQERELQPSEGAWNTLEAQLGTPSRSSNKVMWFAIAASLVSILIVGALLLKEDSTVSTEIVEQSLPAEIETSTEGVASEEIEVLKDEVETIKEMKNTPTDRQTQEAIATSSEVASVQKRTTKVVQNSTEKKPGIAVVQNTIPQTEAVQKLEPKNFIDLKVDEVVAQIGKLQNENTTVTPDAIESLLLKAQRDIANQRLLNEGTTQINPSSLLNDVETELERGFRDKVFDALGEGFNKVRTAVLERNN